MRLSPDACLQGRATTLIALLAACTVEVPPSTSLPPFPIADEAGPKGDHAPLHLRAWTVLYYGAGDNNLADYLAADVNEIESVGSTDEVAFVAFLDQPTGGKAYYLEADPDPWSLNSPSWDLGNIDSGHIETLTGFLRWGIRSYPAEKYALIISGHGGLTPRVIAPDDSTGSEIAIGDLGAAVGDTLAAEGVELHVLGADACLIQTLETSIELSDSVRYVIGSADSEDGDGWPWRRIARYLVENPRSPDFMTDYHGWANEIVSAYGDRYATDGRATLVAIRAYDMPAFIADWLSTATTAMVANPAGRAYLDWMRDQVYRFEYGDYVDLGHFVTLLAQGPSVPGATLAVQELVSWMGLLDDIEHVHLGAAMPPSAVGIGLYFPRQPSPYELDAAQAAFARYRQSPFADRYGWDEALAILTGW